MQTLNLISHYNNQSTLHILDVLSNKNTSKKDEIASSSYEGIIRDVRLLFNSFISHLIEYIEVVKTPKGFLPMALSSKAMGVIVNFRPFPRYLSKKANYGIST